MTFTFWNTFDLCPGTEVNFCYCIGLRQSMELGLLECLTEIAKDIQYLLVPKNISNYKFQILLLDTLFFYQSRLRDWCLWHRL